MRLGACGITTSAGRNQPGLPTFSCAGSEQPPGTGGVLSGAAARAASNNGTSKHSSCSAPRRSLTHIAARGNGRGAKEATPPDRWTVRNQAARTRRARTGEDMLRIGEAERWLGKLLFGM